MPKFISKIVTVFKIFFAWIIHTISFAIPRSERVWVFVGWHRNGEREIFADNAKYMFLHASHMQGICAIWIAKDKKIVDLLRNEGFRSYYAHSLRGIYYALRAGYTFIDAFFGMAHWQYSGRSNVIQLWHGKGMKKTGYDSPYSLQRYHWFTSPHLFEKPAKAIASSAYTARLMASIFRLPEERILITGLPRNDVFHREIKGSEIDTPPGLKQFLSNLKQKKEQCILWAPTFRPSGTNPISQINYDELETFLKERNLHIFISLHPKFAQKEYLPMTEREHIHAINAGYDLYPLLPMFDRMITDYSSIYVDFLLLDKPLIFFTYDLEEYKSAMGLYEDFESLTPGPHAQNFAELLKALDFDQTKWESDRNRVKKVLFTNNNGLAAERITIMLGGTSFPK